jgi:hypothetical protein
MALEETSKIVVPANRNATCNGWRFFVLYPQGFIHPKRKRKKRKRIQLGSLSGCKLFNLKFFRNWFPDQQLEYPKKKFKRNPEGLNLQERKTSA